MPDDEDEDDECDAVEPDEAAAAVAVAMAGQWIDGEMMVQVARKEARRIQHSK